jgi:ADP-heptose:LPS heptosyltransferase
VPLIPAIDRLLPAGELQPIAGLPSGPDVAIDLHGNGPASRRLLAALRPRRLYGFADPSGTAMPSSVGPPWPAGEHEVSRWCRLVTEVLPAPPGGWPRPATGWQAVGCLGLPPVAVPVGVTILHPGAASPARRWPASRFVAVAEALAGRGHRVVVTGGPAERPLAGAIAAEAGVPALPDLSLVELLALVGRARLVVCGDTGLAHVASNYRTPSVLLFGPVSPALWGPPADGPHRVLWKGDGTGDPHGRQVDPALLAISVAQVLDAVDQLSEHDPAAAGVTLPAG